MVDGTTGEPLLDSFGVEILSPDDCRSLLDGATIGRIAYVDAGESVILPINIGTWGGSIVFRTAPGSKLDAAVMSRPASIEIDGYDEATRTGWSVLVKGSVDSVTDEAEVARLDEAGPRPWSRPDLRHNWVRLLPNEITGRRILDSGQTPRA